MWLLDANMPLQLVALLATLGVEADSAVTRDWDRLSNGALLEAALQANFTTLLTRDRLFGESAAGALSKYPDFSIVGIALPQARASQYLAAFRSAWEAEAITPVPGQMITCPERYRTIGAGHSSVHILTQYTRNGHFAAYHTRNLFR